MIGKFCAGLLLASLIAVPAEAGGFFQRTKGGLGAGGGGGGSVDLTLAIRSTQSQLVDLTTPLAACTDTELISATYTGPVALQLSPSEGFKTSTAGVPLGLRKRQLIDFTTAQTSGAAVGTQASVWTLNCGGGSYKIGWNVVNPEINSWNYGAKSAPRRGGFPLYYLPGSAADWAITTNPSGGFEPWNGRIVWKCAGTITQCPTEASNPPFETATGATRVIASPTGTYNVGLTNSTLGITRTIAITAVDNQFDAAPSSSHLTVVNIGGQICDAVGLISGVDAPSQNYGDKIVVEGSKEFPQAYAYTYGVSDTCQSYTTIAQRAGGPAKPSLPYDPGFIVMSPREPWGARVPNFKIDVRGVTCTGCTHKDLSLRISAMDSFTGATGNDSGFTIQNTGVSPNFLSSVQIDHNKSAGIIWSMRAGDGQFNLYITDNYVDPSAAGCNGIFGFAYDGTIDGNWITNQCHDGIDQAMVDSGATHLASVSWNTIVNVRDPSDCQHPDFIQSFYNTVPWLQGKMGDFRGPRIMGNLIVHGITPAIDAAFLTAAHASGCPGVQAGNADLGKEDIDGDGILDGDIGGVGELRFSSEMVGNLVVASFNNGLRSQWVANGAMKRHNTLVYPTYIPNGSNATLGIPRAFITPAGSGDPIIATDGAGAVIDITDNATSVNLGVTSTTTVFGFNPPTPLTGSNNQINLGAAYTTHFNDPYNTDYTSKNAIVDHWTAKAGSGFATTHAGFNWDLTKLDILGRTYDPSVIAPNGSLITSPLCTATETITKSWTTTAVAGDVATQGTPTFSGSPTSTEDVWFIIAQDGFFNLAGGTTHTMTSTDIAHSAPRTIQHLVVKANAGGKGQCSSNALSF